MNWRVALALAGAGGCVEFVAPASPPGEATPALLRINVWVNGPGDSLLLGAQFDPGRDSLGARSVLQPALRIGPDDIAPEPVAGDPSRLHYRWSSSLAAAPAVLELVGPTVEGVSPASRSVSLPLLNRAGPRVIQIDRATDLALSLRVGSADSASGVRPWLWTFRLLSETGVAVSMGGSGDPPGVLTLPAGVFTLVSADSCVVYLDASVSATPGFADDFWQKPDGYGILAFASIRLDWIVRLGAQVP